MQTLGSNYIPLSNSETMFLIYTRNNSLTGYIGQPSSPLNGSMIIIKDANGLMNVSQVQLVSTNSNSVDGSTANRILSTSWDVFRLIYSGGGSSGSFFII